MGRRCEEVYCLQIVPEHLFQSHQDRHAAERLAAQEFEQQHHSRNTDEALARALDRGLAEDESPNVNDENNDYLLALALNREFRIEEEERSFRNVQVTQTPEVTHFLRSGKSVLKAKTKKRDEVKVSSLTKLSRAPQNN